MQVKKMIFAGAGAVLLAIPMIAQKGDKPVLERKPEATTGTITVNARLVLVPAVVRDKKGALIGDLKQTDFALSVGGKPQTIKYFDHDTDVPLTLGLLVDVSHSMQEHLDDERKASQSFLQSMLAPATAQRPADKAFVLHFAHPIELLQDVTDSNPKLAAALRELGSTSSSFHPDENNGDQTDSEGRRQHGGGTSLYDAIYLASDEVEAKQKGRKALIVLTDGVDSGSKMSLPDAIEAAQRADTMVYAIYYKGQEHRQDNDRQGGGGRHGGYGGGGWPGGGGGGYPGGGGGYPGGGGGGRQGGGNNPNGGGGGYKPNVDGKKVLERICGETGGRVFEVDKKQSVDQIYAQISEELRAEYRLGFTPDAVAAEDGYHQIVLTLTNDTLKKKQPFVQTRDGYYTGDSR